MNQEQSGLSKYLSFAAAWALSFGCTVGWGAFVMPGTTFLPVAGSVGTALGMCVGAVIMLIIGVNYHYMMKQYQDAGGTVSYTKQVFGYDHGFLSAWFLSLTYIAIVWANVTALALIARTLFGSLLQFGFHYALAGYDIYFGEVALEIAVLFIATLLCMYARRLAVLLQTVCAAVLLIAVAICFVAVLQLIKGDVASFAPAFSAHKSPFMQICSIVALMPWAFVGFESVSHSAGEYKFPVSKNFVLLVL